MFKTTLIAATLAASAALTASASAQLIPGSDYFTTRADEVARESVADAPRGTAVEASRVYGYTQTIPGSDYGRTIGQEQTRVETRRDTAGPAAPSVSPNADTIVPGSDYGRTISEQQSRASVR